MPKKRVASKRRKKELDNMQFWDLLLHTKWVSPAESRVGAFIDDKSRREAWFDHREQFMVDHIEGHPGHRPGAWWSYEAPQVEWMPDEERYNWMFLLRNGCCDKQEQEAIFRDFQRDLSLYKGHIIHGTGHSRSRDVFKRQAALLDRCGFPATEAMKVALEENVVEFVPKGQAKTKQK